MLRKSDLTRVAFWVECFVVSNLAFLAVDIWFAHSFNDFHHWAEWIPLFFSLVAPVLLLPGVLTGEFALGRYRVVGLVLGGASIVVGIAGMMWHLQGTFFVEQTLHNLVYTAPFAAPLSYAGLGFLLLLPRLESEQMAEYARWVLLLAALGFAGNFLLTLADHEQNGFFHPSEWIGVVSAAFAFSFFATISFAERSSHFARACWVVLGVQVCVGFIGAGLHIKAILAGPSASLLSNAIDTAPLFAPLLFVDLAILAGLGLIALDRNLKPLESSETMSAL